MRAFLGLIFFGSLFAIGYVLVNGIDGTYVIGNNGPVMRGGEVLIAAISAIGALGAFSMGSGETSEVVRVGEEPEVRLRRIYRPVPLVVGSALGSVTIVLVLIGVGRM